MISPDNRAAAIDAVAQAAREMCCKMPKGFSDAWQGGFKSAALLFEMDAAALLDRIAPMLAQRVKPLEWLAPGKLTYALTHDGLQIFFLQNPEPGVWQLIESYHLPATFPSAELAMWAGQERYQRRIGKTLEGGE